MPVRGNGVARFVDGDVMLNATAHAVVNVQAVQQVVFSADYDGIILRVRLTRLLDQLHALLGRRPSRALRFLPTLASGGPAWNDWQPIAAAAVATLANPNPAIADAVLASIEATILTTLLVCQPNTYSDELTHVPSSVAPKHVVGAERYIHDNIQAELTTGLVAAAVGVSVRALFDGFKAFRGMSPCRLCPKRPARPRP